MDEIYDQFLLCKICFETYKRPKTLSCLHTFCEVCLEKHQDAEIERSYRYMLYSRAVSCPICRKKTEMPSGGIKRLPDNFLVSNLNDVISRRKPLVDAPLCEICQNAAESDFRKTATSKCLECSKLLCRSCNDLHRRTKVTQTHTLFDIEVEKDIECKVHKDEVVRFYCELCELCICVVCTFQEHKGHEVSSFTEGMEKYRNSLDNLVGQCRERIGYIKEHIDLISKCETEVKRAEDQIRDTTIDTIAAIRKKEKELMEKLYTEYGLETFEYFKEKTPLQETLETLQSTCTLTDIITKDQNIELLLLKKDIQEKLTLLLQRELLTPPDGMARQVRFTPGHLVFGSIVTDLRHPDGEHCDTIDSGDVHMVEDKGQPSDPVAVVTADQWTTMGQFVHNYNNEQLTQTDKFSCISRGCSPMHVSTSKVSSQWNATKEPDVKQQCHMTGGTPLIKRKIHTDSVIEADQTTSTLCSTDVSTTDKFTNTLVVDTRDRSTGTKRQKVSNQVTDTAGLVNLCHKETGTLGLETAHHGTLTDTVATSNKSTVALPPEQSDKATFTPEVMHNTQFTMTPVVATSNMGVNCHVLGQNKAVGTKTIVMTHTSSGNFDVRTSDQSVGTPWCSSLKTGPENKKDKDTYTNNFNKVDKITATHRIFTDNVGTSTPTVKKRNAAVGTTKLGTMHQSVEADFGYPKPESSSVCAQTTLTFNRDVIMPNRYPREIGVCTEHVEYRTRGTATPKIKRKHKHVATDSIVTQDSCSATTDTEMGIQEVQAGAKPGASNAISTRDSSINAYRGLVQEVSTSTDFEIVAGAPSPDVLPNTDGGPPCVPAVRLSQVSTEVQTVQPDGKASAVDTETTMNSAVLTSDASCHALPTTADSSCNTFPQKTRYVGPLVSPVRLTDTGVVTDTKDFANTGTATEEVLTSDAGTEMVTAEHAAATDSVMLPGDNKSTTTPVPQIADGGAGTLSVSAVTRETAMEPLQSKDVVPVKSTENQTQVTSVLVSTASTGTSTDGLPEARKIESMDMETMTTPTKMVSAETTMSRGVRATDSGICTDRVEMVTTAVDAEKIIVHNVGTGTPLITVCEMATSTVSQAAAGSVTVGTSTLHSVVSSDKATGTLAQIATADAGAMADIVKPYTGQSTSTMTTPVETAEVGVLKRPHTVTRGTEPAKLRRISKGTATPVAEVRETSSMTQIADTEDKAISVMTIKTVSKSTGTPEKKLVSSSTSMRQVQYTDRESSPIRVALVARASSPIRMDTCDRESSPVHFAGCNKAVGVRVDTKETYTSTARIKFSTRGTMYEPTTTFVNREVSPVPELQPSPPATAEKATATPRISYTDREASPVRGFTKEKGTATAVVKTVDRGSAPMAIATKTREISAVVKMATKGVCTPHVTRRESSTEMATTQMVDTATDMPHVSFVEKETSTPPVHTMHKNISTENISTAEKQTSTGIVDVTAAYRETIAVSPLTVTRGTCTPIITTNTRETSPPQFNPMKDRASSPVCVIRMVDKGVSVTRGEILEPQDRFQKVGTSKTPMKPVAENTRPTLACIREDSAELLSSDDDCGTPQECGTHQVTISSPLVSTASITPQKAFMHKETFQTSQPRLGTTLQSTFSSVSSGAPSSILWKVEMATNTPEVSLETKGTSTPPVEKEDKAICTESITMEGKMAACINKLKNVRQRLEQQPLYTQASSQAQISLPSKPPVDSAFKLISMQARSKSVSDSLNEGGLAVTPLVSPLLARGPASSSDSLTASECSDQDLPLLQGRHSRRLGLARKQRLDISQLLLRSASVPENAYPPYERPKLQVRTVQAQVIPKLSVENQKVVDEPNGADQSSAGGAKAKRTKHRARPRETQNIEEEVLNMRRNSDGGDTIRARQDRQKDRFQKLTPMRRLPSLPQSARSELVTTAVRPSPKVRRKVKDIVGPSTQGNDQKE